MACSQSDNTWSRRQSRALSCRGLGSQAPTAPHLSSDGGVTRFPSEIAMMIQSFLRTVSTWHTVTIVSV